MLALLAALVLAAAPAPDVPTTPGQAFRLAVMDCAYNVPPDRWPFTRYASLHAVPRSRRPGVVHAFEHAANSTSTQSRLVKFPVVGDLLLRLDLEELGWDRFSRRDEIDRLATLGVVFNFKGNKRNEDFFADVWETFAFHDPYFRAPKLYSDRYDRGWVDPYDDALARHLTGSDKFVVRADWLLAKLMSERQDGGFYSQLLLHPALESDFYKRVGADIRFVDATVQARHGGAVIRSDVARHNRELQVIPAAFGDVWRTFDFADAGKPDKDVQLALAGKVKHDGREIIYRLPNGLHGYYLADGKGTQVAVVPQAIALDMRAGTSHPIVDRNVANAHKCVSCHGVESGLIPFSDQVSAGITAEGVKLVTLSDDYRKLVIRNRELREYYLTDLGARIGASNLAYAAAVKALTGLDPAGNADGFMVAFDTYTWGTVTPAVAAYEMGYSPERAAQLWEVASGKVSQLGLLHGGRSIRREAWELIVDDALLAPVHPWEKLATPAIVAKPGY